MKKTTKFEGKDSSSRTSHKSGAPSRKGPCNECECTGFQPGRTQDVGLCQICGHFAAQHSNHVQIFFSESDPVHGISDTSGSSHFLGTPFKERDQDPSKNSGLEARDESGRRRFHGAFTGGFSAGLNNSVASAEGFTPATFRSSRADRAKVSQKRTDFMDEEDLQEEFSKDLRAKDDFSNLDSTSGGLSFDKLFQFDLDAHSIGLQMLHTMGIPEKMFSRLQQVQQTPFQHKENTHGLGFSRDPALSIQDTERLTSLSRSVSAGFSNSVLEEADEDVYDNPADNKHNKNLYTSEISQHEQTIGQRVAVFRKPTKSVLANTVISSSRKGSVITQKSNTNVASNLGNSSTTNQLCHDKQPPLSGFRLASASLTTLPPTFPPPEISSDYAPAIFSQVQHEKPLFADPNSRGLALLGPKGKDQAIRDDSNTHAASKHQNPTGYEVHTEHEGPDSAGTSNKQIFQETNARFQVLGQGLAKRFESVGAVETVYHETLRVPQKQPKLAEAPALFSDPANATQVSVTRSVCDFFPDGRVCKLFGLKNPHKKKKNKNDKKKYQIDEIGFDSLPTNFTGRIASRLSAQDSSLFPGQDQEDQDQSATGGKLYDPLADLSDDDDDELDPVERPSIDLFKEIFGQPAEKTILPSDAAEEQTRLVKKERSSNKTREKEREPHTSAETKSALGARVAAHLVDKVEEEVPLPFPLPVASFVGAGPPLPSEENQAAVQPKPDDEDLVFKPKKKNLARRKNF